MLLLSLPDDCLRLLLELLPLQDLLRLRRTNTRLHTLIGLIFASKQSLKLFSSYFELQQFIQGIAEHYVDEEPTFRINPILDDVLVMRSSAPHDSAYQIPVLFPSVTNLIFPLKLLSHLDLPAFFAPWTTQLHSLTIKMNDPRPQILQSLFATLNSMSSLKGLHLFSLVDTPFPPNLTIISQLEVLAIAHYRHALLPLLRHIRSPLTLVLANVHFTAENLETLLSERPGIVESITGLDLGFFHTAKGCRVDNFEKIFSLVCEKLRKIKVLDLMFGEHLPASQMIPQLSKLPKLTDLAIYIGRDQIPANPDKLYSLPQLTAVRRLNLEIFDLTPGQFFHWIPGLFPAIEEIQIKSDFDFDGNAPPLDEFTGKLKSHFKSLKKFSFK